MEIICYLCTIIAKVEIANCKILMAWISTLLLDPLAENSSLRFNIMEEVWKDVVGYEGRYMVSNFGNVISLNYCNSKKTKPISFRYRGTNNLYPYVHLTKNGQAKNWYIHRLVAIAFIPNPNNYPVVNHIDENPANNHVDNLEWCTQKHNCNHGTRNKRISDKHKGVKLSEYHCRRMSECRIGIPQYHRRRKVNQYSMDMKLIKTWDCITDAAESIKGSSSHITECCKLLKRHRSYKGYIWRYAD